MNRRCSVGIVVLVTAGRRCGVTIRLCVNCREALQHRSKAKRGAEWENAAVVFSGCRNRVRDLAEVVRLGVGAAC